jgi:hypothetical protein
MRVSKDNLKMLSAFLLGFAFWLPFLFCALPMCPYSLGFSANTFEIVLNCRIPMFGWNRRLDVIYPPDSFPEGVWTGLFAWILFYLPYFISCVLFYMIFYWQPKPQIEKNEKAEEK